MTSIRKIYGGFTISPLVEFDELVQATRLAIAERVSIEPIIKGCSGSYVIKNRLQQLMTVFKPRDEHPYGPENPKLL